MGIDGGWDLVKCMEAEAPRKPFFLTQFLVQWILYNTILYLYTFWEGLDAPNHTPNTPSEGTAGSIGITCSWFEHAFFRQAISKRIDNLEAQLLLEEDIFINKNVFFMAINGDPIGLQHITTNRLDMTWMKKTLW